MEDIYAHAYPRGCLFSLIDFLGKKERQVKYDSNISNPKGSKNVFSRNIYRIFLGFSALFISIRILCKNACYLFFKKLF